MAVNVRIWTCVRVSSPQNASTRTVEKRAAMRSKTFLGTLLVFASGWLSAAGAHAAGFRPMATSSPSGA